MDGVPAQFEVLEGGVGYITAYGNEFVIVGRCVDPSAVATINHCRLCRVSGIVSIIERHIDNISPDYVRLDS